MMALSSSSETPAGILKSGCQGDACTGCQGGFFSRLFDRIHAHKHSSFDCQGSHGCQGVAIPVVPQKAPEPLPAPREPVKKSEAPADRETGQVVVELPAGATLLVNGELAKLTTERPTLTTPLLAEGKSYRYTLRAEVSRSGTIYAQEQQVSVVAGETKTVSFANLGAVPVDVSRSATGLLRR
jgi:uncharacterized protein (TIGR03000 family)